LFDEAQIRIAFKKGPCVKDRKTKRGKIMPEPADVLMLALVIGAFALAFAYAHLCARVLGRAESRDLSL
jgi:hypothetical protein